MPLKTPIRSIKMAPFEGFQEISLADIAGPEALVIARNVHVSGDGRAQRAFAPETETTACDDKLGYIFGASSEDLTDNRKDFVAAEASGTNHGQTLWWSIGGSVTSAATSWTAWGSLDDWYERPVAFVEFGGKVYATCNRAITPYAITVSTGAGAAVTRTDFDGTSARFPAAMCLAQHQNLVFAANVQSTSGGVKNSRLHWSNLLDAETWDAADYIDFDPDDGQWITAIVPLGEDLVVFKNQKIYLLTGRSEASFTVYRITNEYGTEYPASVIQHDGVVYFVDIEHGPMAFDGEGIAWLGEGIAETLDDVGALTARQQERWQHATAVYGENVLFSFFDAFGFESLEYDPKAGSWARHDWGFRGAMQYDHFALRLSGSGNAVLGSQNTGTDLVRIPWRGNLSDSHYAGAVFDDDDFTYTTRPGSMIRSPWFVPSSTGQAVRIRRIATYWQGPGGNATTDGQAVLRIYVNGEKAYYKKATITIPEQPSEAGEVLPDTTFVDVITGFSDRKVYSFCYELEFTGRDTDSITETQYLGMGLALSMGGRNRGPSHRNAPADTELPGC